MRTLRLLTQIRSALLLSAILCCSFCVPAHAQSGDKNPGGTGPGRSTSSPNAKPDPEAKEEEVKLTSLDQRKVEPFVDHDVRVSGTVGDHEPDNIKRFDFRMTNKSMIQVVGPYPEIPHVRYTMHGRVAKEGGKYVIQATSLVRDPAGSGTVQFDPLLAIGLVLILAAVVTTVALAARSKAAQQKILMEQQIQEERRRAEAVRVEADRARNDAGKGARPGGPGATVVAGPMQDKSPAVRARTIVSIGSLEAIKGPYAGQKFPLQSGENRIGRRDDRDCDIVLERDGEVSGYHGSVIVTVDGRALFKDESTNGSFINGQTVHHRQVELQSGTDVEVGGSTLRINLRNAPQSQGQASPESVAVSAPVSGTPLSAGLNLAQPIVAQDPAVAVSRRSAQTITVDPNGPTPKRAAAATQAGFAAEFEITSGPESGQRYQILRTVTTLGREDRDILLSDDTISRSHATLVVTDGKFVLKDDNSAHGTQVNGERITSSGTELSDGDRISLGSGLTALVFRRIGV